MAWTRTRRGKICAETIQVRTGGKVDVQSTMIGVVQSLVLLRRWDFSNIGCVAHETVSYGFEFKGSHV